MINGQLAEPWTLDAGSLFQAKEHTFHQRQANDLEMS